MSPHSLSFNSLKIADQVESLNDKLLKYLYQYPYQTNELLEASIYAVISPGHRWRPILFFSIYEALTKGRQVENCIQIACTTEYLHTASIILDDLPSMDDGSLRRGKEPCHLKFGQARTILAALWLCDVAQYLVHDFQVVNTMNGSTDLEDLLRSTKNQMMKGQTIDLEGGKLTIDEIIEKCRLKSGALYGFTASAPAYILGLTEIAKNLEEFGNNLGIAYQISDDIHDCINTAEELGKDVRKDEDRNTIPQICGLQKAAELSDFYKKKAIDKVVDILKPFDITELADSICA